MIYWIIGIIVYIIIGIFGYQKLFSKMDATKFEKIWYSVFWIALVPLYGIRKIQELFM